jgi:hypothetical protein
MSPQTARISKRKLTLAEAADQWQSAKREIDRLKPLLEEAAPVLLAHFEKTGRSSYKDRIALTIGASKLVLDQPKIREFLAERLGEFQKKTAPSRSLTLLK